MSEWYVSVVTRDERPGKHEHINVTLARPMDNGLQEYHPLIRVTVDQILATLEPPSIDTARAELDRKAIIAIAALGDSEIEIHQLNEQRRTIQANLETCRNELSNQSYTALRAMQQYKELERTLIDKDAELLNQSRKLDQLQSRLDTQAEMITYYRSLQDHAGQEYADVLEKLREIQRIAGNWPDAYKPPTFSNYDTQRTAFLGADEPADSDIPF